MLSRSFIPNFGQGSFPKIAGKSPGTLIFFLTIGYVTHSFFIHLGSANVNWVFNISNKYLFWFFQLGIFVNVKTLLNN